LLLQAPDDVAFLQQVFSLDCGYFPPARVDTKILVERFLIDQRDLSMAESGCCTASCPRRVVGKAWQPQPARALSIQAILSILIRGERLIRL
jgi:hypothetical protein